jgi:pyridoxal phosphate enzyme (YggS family)
VTDIADSVAVVRARIEDAARRAGRDPSTVRIVAATKTVPAARIVEAMHAGIADVGENRAQELLVKAVDLESRHLQPCWHFVGPLQRNKVRALTPWIDLWQTVDRDVLGLEISRRAPGARVLVEVNLAGEPQKAGCAPADAPALVDQLREQGLDVRGLMTVPPAHEDPRPWFGALRSLAARLSLPELSMGMTDDFDVAVEEGATMVRIGRALFGARPTG